MDRPARIIGHVVPAAHPTVRLADGGDVPTYDAETTAAVLDEHTDHLRQLEARVTHLDSELIRAQYDLAYLRKHVYRPWWRKAWDRLCGVVQQWM